MPQKGCSEAAPVEVPRRARSTEATRRSRGYDARSSPQKGKPARERHPRGRVSKGKARQRHPPGLSCAPVAPSPARFFGPLRRPARLGAGRPRRMSRHGDCWGGRTRASALASEGELDRSNPPRRLRRGPIRGSRRGCSEGEARLKRATEVKSWPCLGGGRRGSRFPQCRLPWARVLGAGRGQRTPRTRPRAGRLEG